MRSSLTRRIAFMPSLILGEERCELRPGTNTIGGRGADALPLPALEWKSAVATITVPPPGMGAALIRRTSASVVVRVNDELLGIAAAELFHGSVIEFKGCRLTFEAVEPSAIAAATSSAHQYSAVLPHKVLSLATGIGARLINVQTGKAFALTDRRVVIGRDESCDIVIVGMGISRRHASVSPVAGGYLLRDESANGTKVNGAAVIATYLLAHGDVVQLNDEELRYDVEGSVAVAASGTNSEATQILDLSQVRRSLDSTTTGRRLSCTLEIVRGPYAGATFALDKPVCSIGRAQHNDVIVPAESVSAAHATLLRKGASWYVVDLRSANGTFVDGSRVAGEREVASGARLKVGEVELLFRAFADGEDAGAARPVRVGFRKWLAPLIRLARAG